MFIIKKTCQDSPDKCYTERKAIHEPCGYASNLVCSFDSKQNKQSFYRGNDCIKKFCGDLKESERNIVKYEQKRMIPLTDNKNRYYEEQK